jgi:hypothetical protein
MAFQELSAFAFPQERCTDRGLLHSPTAFLPPGAPNDRARHLCSRPSELSVRQVPHRGSCPSIWHVLVTMRGPVPLLPCP